MAADQILKQNSIKFSYYNKGRKSISGNNDQFGT